MPSTTPPTHLDWADEAEAAERAGAWLQATALWRRAIDRCDDPIRRGAYERAAAACETQVAIDERLTAIARSVLQISTLETRGRDDLDRHTVPVRNLKQALRLAYGLDRNPT